MKTINIDWFFAAMIRSVKTMAQTALGMFTVGAALNDIQWMQVLSVAVVAGIYSLLTSLATGLPEVGSDGTLRIDTSDPNKNIYRLDITSDLDKLATKSVVKLNVDPKALLSQK